MQPIIVFYRGILRGKVVPGNGISFISRFDNPKYTHVVRVRTLERV
jgi:hypothetical protein